MMNLIVLLLIWGAGMVLCYAWRFSRALRRTFREEVVTEPVPAYSAAEQGGQRVLSYAAPPRNNPLTRQWPVLDGVLAFVMVFPLMVLPVIPLLALALGGTVRAPAVACAVALGATLLAMALVTIRGLRDVDGRPAAVNWRYLGRAMLCWVGVVGLTWAVLEWRVQRILDGVLARADALGAQIEGKHVDGCVAAGAAGLYQQAGVGTGKGIEFSDGWELVTADGRVSAPPAFPEKHAFRIPLLREAAAMEVGGLAPRASECPMGVPPPHRDDMLNSASLLHRHAIHEARAGRVRSAVADINALHGLARHAEQGLSLVGMAAATAIRMSAEDALQHVLPMMTEAGDLDLLRLEDPAGCMPATRRCVEGELGILDRRKLVMTLRGQTGLSPMTNSGSVSGALPSGVMAAYRVVLGESDIDVVERLAAELPAAIPDDPAAAAKVSAALNGRAVAAWHQGFVAGMQVPAIGKVLEWHVEGAARTALSRAAVAATRFRLQQGRLPASFDELVQAGLLPAVPIDPFSGQPMLFAAHKDFVFLYTIGIGRANNGGTPYMIGRGGAVLKANPGVIISDRPLWELDLVPPGGRPAP